MKTIYKITNTLNNKSYIGQTSKSILERWKQHIYDSKKDKHIQNRSLYFDINKYGPDIFSIIEIEKCLDEDAYNREIYWINYYNTFKDGYNNTYGGEGKHYINYNEVYQLYSIHKNCTKVAELLNISVDSVYNILNKYNIKIKSSSDINKDTYNKPINMYDLNGNFLRSFYSISDASKFIDRNFGYSKSGSHIRDCANKLRQTAYGFKWKFDSELLQNNENIKIFKYSYK